MMFDVPEPGLYGLVLPDGELRLWVNRGRDSTRTWKIWSNHATTMQIAGDTRTQLGRTVHRLLVSNVAERNRGHFDDTGPDALRWRPIRFGPAPPPHKPAVSVPVTYTWLRGIQRSVNTRVWWTNPRENALDRRALYMPAMPRDELILLARNLEARADAGAKRINHAPIGEWIRQAWTIIERREGGDRMGVLP
jgi:hypothetical protein